MAPILPSNIPPLFIVCRGVRRSLLWNDIHAAGLTLTPKLLQHGRKELAEEVAEDLGEEPQEEFQEEFGEEFGEESREAVATREQRLKRNVSLMTMTSYVTPLHNSLFNAH